MAASTITLENLLPYDNQDVIIRRTEQFKTKTRTELLVLLATQHQYYVKNVDTGTLENLLPYDNQDVIIRRTEQFKTKTRTELLVLLATQHQYYVKNVDTGHIAILAADPEAMFSSSVPVAWKDKHTKNIMRSLARFIPDSRTTTIDHPIHARWLRGIEMNAYANNGKVKEGYKAVLNTVSRLINLDVAYDLMNKNPGQYQS